MDAYLHQSQVQKQSQVLAPQLRQSLEVLQAPLLELQALITRELELNPTLEVLDPDHERLEVESESHSDFEDVSDKEFEEEFELLARLDDDARESFQRNELISRPSSDDEAKRQFMLESRSQPLTLQQHLTEQLHMLSMDSVDTQFAELLIGSLDDDGYLSTPLDELAESVAADPEHMEEVLWVLQEFDPVGVASRTLQECLRKQLDRMGMSQSVEMRLVEHHLTDLAGHKYADIARRQNLTLEKVREAAAHIALLDPKPGRRFQSDETVYVMPEVFVRKIKGEWKVQTNNSTLPRLRISKQYRELMKDPSTTKEVKRYIRDKLKGGSTLMKSLGQRQDTLTRIAEELVEHQTEFLEEGVEKLRPLTMSTIADKLGLHETTISRAVANKYMQTPRGVFELKYFFTPGYQTADGEVVSNKSVKEVIKGLVDEEDPSKPLSDQAMVKELSERGFKVARRTVAKYRDELHILPSHLRKV